MRAVLAFCLCALPAPVLAAGLDCSFTTECFETEACSDTDYTFSLARTTDTDALWQMTTPSETLPAMPYRPEGAGLVIVTGEGAGAAHITALSDDGKARYVTMLHDGPMLVTYHGTCVETGQ